MVLLMMGLAWASGLRVPPGQSAAVWEDALALTGLTLVQPIDSAIAELINEDGAWTLRVLSPDGTWRTTTVPPPDSAAHRETIARNVLLMRAKRDAVEHPWELQAAALPAIAATPAPRPPPPENPKPAWIAPPRFQKARPAMGPIEVVSVYPVLTPLQVVSYPTVLHPEAADPDRAPALIRGGWVWAGAGGAARPEVAAGLSLIGDIGLRLGDQWKVGGGGSWQQAGSLSAITTFDAELQTTTAHVGAWRSAAAYPVAAGAAAGVSVLSFRQDGVALAASPLWCPSALLELSAGRRLQVYGRARADMTILTMSEVAGTDTVGEATMSPWTLWFGARVVGAWDN